MLQTVHAATSVVLVTCRVESKLCTWAHRPWTCPRLLQTHPLRLSASYRLSCDTNSLLGLKRTRAFDASGPLPVWSLLLDCPALLFFTHRKVSVTPRSSEGHLHGPSPEPKYAHHGPPWFKGIPAPVCLLVCPRAQGICWPLWPHSPAWGRSVAWSGVGEETTWAILGSIG